MNFKVTFFLDGAGVVYNPAEPIHLDALLHWCLVPFHKSRVGLGRDETPDDIPLPLLKQQVNGTWIWQASALFPEGHTTESLQHWRKRFRQDRIELTSGAPNLQNGPYRDYNMPLPLLHTQKMVAYASGSRKRVKKLLKNIKYLGKKRAYGYGAVINIELEETEENYSIVMEGNAMRWIPKKNGSRFVRPRPPYWNSIGRVGCCEVGDIINGCK